jgi:hypothetical protein
VIVWKPSFSFFLTRQVKDVANAQRASVLLGDSRQLKSMLGQMDIAVEESGGLSPKAINNDDATTTSNNNSSSNLTSEPVAIGDQMPIGKRAKPRPPSAEYWPCPSCRCSNPSEISECDVCNEPKPVPEIEYETDPDYVEEETRFDSQEPASVAGETIEQQQQQLQGGGKKMRAKPRPPSAEYWPCPSCRCSNPSEISECDVCNEPKPVPEIEYETDPDAADGDGEAFDQGDGEALYWVCPHCKSMNPGYCDECDACYEAKPTPVVVSVPKTQDPPSDNSNATQNKPNTNTTVTPDNNANNNITVTPNNNANNNNNNNNPKPIRISQGKPPQQLRVHSIGSQQQPNLQPQPSQPSQPSQQPSNNSQPYAQVHIVAPKPAHVLQQQQAHSPPHLPLNLNLNNGQPLVLSQGGTLRGSGGRPHRPPVALVSPREKQQQLQQQSKQAQSVSPQQQEDPFLTDLADLEHLLDERI